MDNMIHKKLNGEYRIKKDYDSTSKMCIYVIENIIDGKCYIGATSMTMLKRMNDHFSTLRNNRHGNIYLQEAYNRDGEDAFKVSVLYDNAENRDVLACLEGVYCSLYRADNKDFGYNIIIPGWINEAPKETKDKMCAAWTDEKKKAKSNEYKARHLVTPITPPVVSVDGIKRIADKAKERFKNGTHHFIGRNYSAEEIAKRTAKMKGRFLGYKNPASKAILAYDIGDQRQYYFRTVKEAAFHFNINTCTIERIMKGRPTKTGLNFKYA